MNARVDGGRAYLSDKNSVAEGLKEFFGAMGIDDRISSSVIEEVKKCFDDGAEPTAEEIQRRIADAFQQAQVGRVLCAGACLFFAGMAVGAMAPAYLVTDRILPREAFGQGLRSGQKLPFSTRLTAENDWAMRT